MIILVLWASHTHVVGVKVCLEKALAFCLSLGTLAILMKFRLSSTGYDSVLPLHGIEITACRSGATYVQCL